MQPRGAFHEESAEFDSGAVEARRREATQEAFRQTIDALERAWPIEHRHNPFFPFVTWTQAGPRLGSGTLLVPEGEAAPARMLALISIACGCAVPAGALLYLERAEAEFARGRYAQSALQVALSGIPPLKGEDAARRLYFAAGILDAGFVTPARLMTTCGFNGAGLVAMGA